MSLQHRRRLLIVLSWGGGDGVSDALQDGGDPLQEKRIDKS